MPDLATTINEMQDNGDMTRIAVNPRAQFGRPQRRYVGAEVLPERTVEANAYTEDAISYRTVIANSGTRYSPAQKKGADIVGEMDVRLAESDIAREMTGREYEALLRHLRQNMSMEAMASLTNWLDTTVNVALIELLEQQRWQALINAQVIRLGDNGYREEIGYPDPANHRVTAALPWSDNNTDIFEDVFTQADLLQSKGYTVSRLITSRQVVSIMANNDKVKSRVGVAVVNPSGQIMSAMGRATLDAINSILQQDGLPPIETYDLMYRTEVGTEYFLPRDAMLMVGATGNNQELDLGDEIRFMENTLGYTAIGTAAGQPQPGRFIRAESFKNKPPRIEAEGWQTSLPVITEPEAISVIKGIS